MPDEYSLRELKGTFLRRGRELINGVMHDVQEHVDTLSDSEGVSFLCPLCWHNNNGPVGTHIVICWWTGVPPEVFPNPGRWNPSGSGLDDLTFVPPGQVSVQIVGGCKWHGHIRNGKATLQ